MLTRSRATPSSLYRLLVPLVLAGCLGGRASLGVANDSAAPQTVHVKVVVDEKGGVREILNHTFVLEPGAWQRGNLGIRETHTFHVAADTETGWHNSSTFQASNPVVFVDVLENYIKIWYARP